MKTKILMTGLAIVLGASASSAAVSLKTSKSNIRFSKTNPSQTFSITTTDDLSCLDGKTGTFKAKVAVSKKYFEDPPKTIEIPYTDGEIGSTEITLSLKDADSIPQSTKTKLKVKGRISKNCKLKALKTNLNIDIGQIKVSGSVLVPTSRANSRRKNLLGRSIVPLNAEEAAGTTVELIQVDSEGQQVGEPVATAVTDSEGHYELEMPEGAVPSTEYVIAVDSDNDGAADMHSFVTQDEELVVDPVSEFIFENVTEEAVNDDSTGLSVAQTIEVEDFTDTEINAVREQMDELNPDYEPTVTETITSFEGSLGSFLDNLIDIAKGEGDENDGADAEVNETKIKAKGIAGDYFVTFTDFGLSGLVSETTEDASLPSTIGALELGAARLSKPTPAGALAVTSIPILSASMRLEKTGEFNENFGRDDFGGDQGGGDFDQGPGDDFGGGPGDEFGQEPGDDFGTEPGDEISEGIETFSNGEELTEEPSPEPEQQEEPDDQLAEGDDSNFPSGDDFGPEAEFGEGPEGDFGEGGQDDERSDFGPGTSAYNIAIDTNRNPGNIIDEFFVSINSANVISFVEPGETEIYSGGPGPAIGYRSDPEQQTYYPVGTGMFIAAPLGVGNEYDLSTGEDKLTDYILGFGTLVKESNISSTDLNGTYGLVGLGLDLAGHGRLGALSIKGLVEVVNGFATPNFSGEVELSRETNDGETFTVTMEGAGVGVEIEDRGGDSNAVMTAQNGKITLSILESEEEAQRCGDHCDKSAEELFEGFARPDGGIITFVSFDNRKNGRNPRQYSSASREINFAIRTSATAPSLDGNVYHLLSYGVQFLTTGAVVMEQSNGGTMSFAGTTATFSDVTLHQISRLRDDGAITKTVVNGLSGSATATFSTNSSIDITVGDSTLTGYVSEDEKMIVMQGTTADKVSIYVGVLQE